MTDEDLIKRLRAYAQIEHAAAPWGFAGEGEVMSIAADRIEALVKERMEGLREAAAILRREIERVDAIAPEKKATPHRRDQRKVSLFAVASEYAEIEREILALIPKSTSDGGGVGGGRE